MPILELNGQESAIRRFLRAIASALFRPLRTPTRKWASEPQPLSADSRDQIEPGPANQLRHRLSDEMHCLEQLDSERQLRGDPGFGKATEDRIVWGELLELELEQIDEEMNRMFRPPRGKRISLNSTLPEGGPHEPGAS